MVDVNNQLENSVNYTTATVETGVELLESTSAVDCEIPAYEGITDELKPVSGMRRLLLLMCGILMVVLAGIGVILPGLPATGPLIIASICLTKSSPALERRLVRSRFFAPFHQYLDGNAAIPRRARIVAFCMMWVAISISAFFILRQPDSTDGWLVAILVASGVAGSVMISRFRRHLPDAVVTP